MVDRQAPSPQRRGARGATIVLGLACLAAAGFLTLQQRDESHLLGAGMQELAGHPAAAIAGAARVARSPARGPALVVRAQAEVDLGRYAEAATDYRAALRRDPQNWSIHHDLGAALLAAGDDAAATSEFLTALRLDPLQ